MQAQKNGIRAPAVSFDAMKTIGGTTEVAQSAMDRSPCFTECKESWRSLHVSCARTTMQFGTYARKRSIGNDVPMALKEIVAI